MRTALITGGSRGIGAAAVRAFARAGFRAAFFYRADEAAAQAVQDTYETIVQEDGYSYDWYNDWTDEQWAAVALDVNADA